MQEKIIKEYLNTDRYMVVDVEYIVKNISNLKISTITINSAEHIRGENSVCTFKMADKEHPLVFEKGKDSLVLYIDSDWYVDSQTTVDNLICFIVLNTPLNEISIENGCLISGKVIDFMCQSKNLESVNLGRYSSDGYKLKLEDYLKFKKSKIKSVDSRGVEEELKENFDEIIEYNRSRGLILYHRYNDLNDSKIKNIIISSDLTDEYLENLKYLPADKTLELNEKTLNSLIPICNRLNELGKNNKVVMKVDNKKEFNDFIFANQINYENFYVSSNFMELPLKKYMEFEKLLYSMIAPAKNLSTFEQYIYVYNLTKRYKLYKENENDKSASRKLYNILENEYMVCVGYAALFGDLLEKLGIKSLEMGISVDSSYDKVTNDEITPEIVPTERNGHARRYVHIVDEKYGIDGFYVSDPTWDNSMDNDLYNYLAITDEEVTKSRRYVWMNTYGVDELFNTHSIDEIYKKINFLLDRNKKKTLKDFVYDMVSRINSLDKDYIIELEKKYDYINKGSFSYPDDVLDLLNDLSTYIVNHVNREISGETIMSAVENVYRKTNIFSEDKIEEELQRTKDINRRAYEINFPRRKKEYIDGHVEEKEYKNKFDIESIEKTIQ